MAAVMRRQALHADALAELTHSFVDSSCAHRSAQPAALVAAQQQPAYRRAILCQVRSSSPPGIAGEFMRLDLIHLGPVKGKGPGLQVEGLDLQAGDLPTAQAVVEQ